jgi:transposase
MGPLGEDRLESAQSGKKPLGIVLGDGGLSAVLGFEARIAQYQRLRERERGLAEVQVVQVGAEVILPRYHLQWRRSERAQVLADDAAAICEAASRPSMRFIPVKSVEQQSMLCVHRLREGLKADRVACITMRRQQPASPRSPLSRA